MAENPGIANLRPGNKRGPAKMTRLLKDAILQAAAEAGGEDGLVGYLRSQALRNPAPFLSLLGRVLPMQLAGDPENPIEVHHSAAVELKSILAGMSANMPKEGE